MSLLLPFVCYEPVKRNWTLIRHLLSKYQLSGPTYSDIWVRWMSSCGIKNAKYVKFDVYATFPRHPLDIYPILRFYWVWRPSWWCRPGTELCVCCNLQEHVARPCLTRKFVLPKSVPRVARRVYLSSVSRRAPCAKWTRIRIGKS